MLNTLQLEKVTKEDVAEQLRKMLASMNNHQFKKLKNILNKKGMLNDVLK